MKVSDVDWTAWVPTDRATLLFVVRGGEVLLIEKKRGLGAGKVNAPGGRIEPGETPVDGAVREAREEVGVEAFGLSHHGELWFEFVDGYRLHCHVFRAEGCRGEAIETDEAVPLWTPLGAIPWARMWADDALWLPIVLEGGRFEGRFVFDGDRMLDHHLERRRDDV